MGAVRLSTKNKCTNTMIQFEVLTITVMFVYLIIKTVISINQLALQEGGLGGVGTRVHHSKQVTLLLSF